MWVRLSQRRLPDAWGMSGNAARTPTYVLGGIEAANYQSRYFLFAASPRKVFAISGFALACGTWQAVQW